VGRPGTHWVQHPGRDGTSGFFVIDFGSLRAPQLTWHKSPSPRGLGIVAGTKGWTAGLMEIRLTDSSMTHPADIIPVHYERHALSWDADRRAADWNDRPWIERFASLLPVGAAVLDLGCGGGAPVAMSMAANGLQLTGVDISPTLISLCRSRMPDQQWVVADMRSLTLRRRFDGVLAWDSFFHLKPDDQRATFHIFAAHAAKGAILMFNAGRGCGEAIGCYRGDPLYHASLDAAEYEGLLASTGFERIEHSINDPAKGGRVVWIARKIIQPL
jgi:SAM-dependent methyltransferase